VETRRRRPYPISPPLPPSSARPLRRVVRSTTPVGTIVLGANDMARLRRGEAVYVRRMTRPQPTYQAPFGPWRWEVGANRALETTTPEALAIAMAQFCPIAAQGELLWAKRFAKPGRIKVLVVTLAADAGLSPSPAPKWTVWPWVWHLVLTRVGKVGK
jgi:hypothetical protein